MKRVLLALVGLWAALTLLPAVADLPGEHAAEIAAATLQAEHWLGLLDGGLASETWESWDDLAAVMKDGRTRQDWANDIGKPRVALGTLVTRKLQSATYSTSVRGAPEGAYVTVIFLCQFTKALPVLETVLLSVEDGKWRIAGYDVGQAAPATGEAPAGAGAKPGE